MCYFYIIPAAAYHRKKDLRLKTQEYLLFMLGEALLGCGSLPELDKAVLSQESQVYYKKM